MVETRELAGTELFDGLKRLLRGRCIIVGIGNALRGDDGLGPLLVGRLRKRTTVPCINVGMSPERYLGKIAEAQPDSLLLIDAMILGFEPGGFALVTPDEIPEQSLMAHGASVKMTCLMLSERVHAQIGVLGIQPATLEMGCGVSQEVRHSLRILEEEIVGAIGSSGGVRWR